MPTVNVRECLCVLREWALRRVVGVLAGYFGADCSLSLDPKTGQVVQLEGLGYRLAPQGPYVYVYEVPPRFNTW